MTGHADRQPIRISILALPESTPAMIYGLYEVLTSVGVIWHQLTGVGEPRPRFMVDIVSLDGKPYPSPVGIPITPNAALGDVGQSDVVIVTDLALSLDFEPKGRWPEMAEWLRARRRDGAIVCSVCTGTVLLAEAGLLDDTEATTHWSACDLFARHFPNIALRPERIIVPAGEGHRVITSGGSASWEDLVLYLIGRLCSPAEAIHTAKIFLFGDRDEGQLPYAAMIRPRNHSDAIIRDCQEWVGLHYDDTNPVAKMVARSGLNERTFKRRFRAATGQSPMDYVQTLRIEEAKQELETTDTATDEIAHSVGYEDPTYFRRLFKKRTGITPSRYRQRFRTVARVGD